MNVSPYIRLPQDQYAHPGAPAEWWWHIGSLNCGSRQFGFEISAAGFLQSAETPSFLMANIMLTDVAAVTHYQQITAFPSTPDWAQADPEQPWSVNVGASGIPGAIAMHADPANPLMMNVQGSFVDAVTGVGITLNLNFEQGRGPLLVWATGRSPEPVDPSGKTPLERYNYYYSLTDLNVTGTVTIGSELFEVTGLTWMDHEYGAWPQSTKWALQDCQLNNGIRLSNFTEPNIKLVENVPVPSHVTVLWPDGMSTFESSTATPLAPSWTSPSGTVYFPKMLVEIPALNASFTVTSLIPGQEFWNPQIARSQVYEGVALAEGVFDGEPVSGQAWNEQHLA
ncbi:lipocalin-like domain-containing protein [Collimonas silvisoli]|uniref:lipocalin-like domain-containing protein n=1 Tax=Collimonas silvisoli TaxID=2825884 RepID=UPI001B8CDAB3|nr:lipocalin-like domain-containing protein [Collimonas silvisoli]